MGSSSSKVVGKAAAATTRRQYPSTSSILNNTTSSSNAPASQARPSEIHPNPRAAPPASNKSEHIDLDGRDPQFGSKLRQLGPVVPVGDARPQEAAFQTSPQRSVFQQGHNIFPPRPATGGNGFINPAIVIVQARERIGKIWEEETDSLGRGSFTGRTMLSANEIADVIEKRDGGVEAGTIEKQMRLSKGLVKKLGLQGIVANA